MTFHFPKKSRAAQHLMVCLFSVKTGINFKKIKNAHNIKNAIFPSHT